MEDNGTRRTRTQDILQSISILVLLVALLIAGSLSVNYMVKSSMSEAKYELVKEENRILLEQLETRMNSSVDRKVSSLEDRVFTVEQTLKFYEHYLERNSTTQ